MKNKNTFDYLNNLDSILRVLNGNKNPFKGVNEERLSKAGFIGYDRLRKILHTLQTWDVIPANCNWEDMLDNIVDEIMLLGY